MKGGQLVTLILFVVGAIVLYVVGSRLLVGAGAAVSAAGLPVAPTLKTGRTLLPTSSGQRIERPDPSERFQGIPSDASVVIVNDRPISLATGLTPEEFAARLAP